MDQVLRLCAEKKLDPRQPLSETRGLLISLTRQAFARMVDIDRRLRGNGFPDHVSPRNPERKQQAMEAFINARIDAELRALQASPSRWISFNRWFKEHPVFGFLIATAIALAGLLSKLLGAW